MYKKVYKVYCTTGLRSAPFDQITLAARGPRGHNGPKIQNKRDARFYYVHLGEFYRMTRDIISFPNGIEWALRSCPSWAPRSHAQFPIAPEVISGAFTHSYLVEMASDEGENDHFWCFVIKSDHWVLRFECLYIYAFIVTLFLSKDVFQFCAVLSTPSVLFLIFLFRSFNAGNLIAWRVFFIAQG